VKPLKKHNLKNNVMVLKDLILVFGVEHLVFNNLDLNILLLATKKYL